MEGDVRYYTRRVEQELRLAAGTTDKAVKAAHLDMAARYATLRELACAPHGTEESVATAVDYGFDRAPY